MENNDTLDQHFQLGSDDASLQTAMVDLTGRLKSVASWFYWIAGLSFAGDLFRVLHLVSIPWFKLGLTEFASVVIDIYFPLQHTWVLTLIGYMVVPGLFVVFGIMLARGKAWALWLGVVLYGLDSLDYLINGISLMAYQMLIPAAVHGFFLFKLWPGFTILRQIKKLRSAKAGSATV